MPHVARLYESDDKARDAVEKLKAQDFSEDEIFVVSPGSGRTASAVKATPIPESDAAVYVERVDAGRTLVVSGAPFGRGTLAKELMEEAGPVDTDLELPSVLVQSSSKAVFSEFLGWAPLTTKRYQMSWLFGDELLRTPGYKIFGGSTNNFSLSRMFGMPMLTSPPKDSSFGMSLLSSNRTPFSSMFGMKMLTGGRTPLSSMLGMSLLTERRR